METARTRFTRPLDKGMILSQSSQTIPDGAFLDLNNFHSSLRGIRRRPGFLEFAGGAALPYKPIDIITVWTTSGIQKSVVLTEKTLFFASVSGGYTEIPWGGASIADTIASSGGISYVLTQTGATFLTDDIRVGDLIRTSMGEGSIVEIIDDENLVIEGLLETGALIDYTLQRAFGQGYEPRPHGIVFEGFLLIVDGVRPIMALDIVGETIDYWIDDPVKNPAGTTYFSPAVIGVFLDRIWVGYTYDDVDGIQRQRIRWSALADPRNFGISTNYLDLPYSSGALLRILPQGNSLILYFQDRIYRGTQTNYPTLPLRFDVLESGGVGLGGTYGVCSYVGGHFFIGNDDIYFLNSNEIQRISVAITRLLFQDVNLLFNVYATVDLVSGAIVFGIPDASGLIPRLWYFDFKSQSWSYSEITVSMVANPLVNQQLTWDDLGGTWDGLSSAYETWNSMRADDPRRFLYISRGNVLERASLSGALDTSASPIRATFTTKDHDFEEPDQLKACVRFGIKICSEEARTEPIIFTVRTSVNRGLRWKAVGQLVIRPDYDEGYVNFRNISSTIRVELTTESPVDSYTITEYALRVRISGEELDVSTQT